MSILFKQAIISLISYLIGCLNGAYYYGKIFKNMDIRNYGSGNPGALNSGRVFGRDGFIIVFFIDFLKGAIVVIIGRYYELSNQGLVLAILAVIAGHMYPVQLQFKGGKGMAAFLGALAFYDYIYVLYIVVVFLLFFILTRRFTISGLASLILLPAILYFRGYASHEVLAMTVFALIIILRHRENIHDFLKPKN
ncbi:MAG TPA: glycerol-3-phosphate acyltransferase [Desulfitobacteriaceae bacterium]|nr:glycerol-3-phosphate acyltransferase [Desulfitobacteriaceae bacterium]